MGHIHLAVLPQSKKWRHVAKLLSDGGASADIIASSLRAAEKDLAAVESDPVLAEAVRLLAAIPAAARDADFAGALQAEGLEAGSAPDRFALVAAAGRRLDTVVRQHGRPNDFGELARRAVLSSFLSEIDGRLSDPQRATPSEVRVGARDLSEPRAFSQAARTFLTRLTTETLRYWLDRHVPTHTGPGERFADAGARSAFDRDLARHCADATDSIREFAAGWYAATLRRDGRIGHTGSEAFASLAFRKVVEELRAGSDANG